MTLKLHSINSVVNTLPMSFTHSVYANTITEVAVAIVQLSRGDREGHMSFYVVAHKVTL